MFKWRTFNARSYVALTPPPAIQQSLKHLELGMECRPMLQLPMGFRDQIVNNVLEAWYTKGPWKEPLTSSPLLGWGDGW